jgi:lipoprotein-anchoring transpeptidase ErfK/SrfK
MVPLGWVCGATMILRSIIVLALAAVLAGCNYRDVPDPSLSARDAEFMAKVPNVEMDLGYDRYEIDDPTGEAPGTIIVDTKANFLYFVLPNKRAIRYGVATGSEAFGWTGTATVKRKAEWPRWMPPAEMVQRWPHLRPTLAAGGLGGGPDNPLGARALYLYQGNRDTLYRIHGTNEPDKIGRNVSSGCIRMRNIDVVDLYNRTPLGAKVIVR